ncbi:hypothetical protein [Novacetimonas cocois]|uniref:hypothetical protein n=1 Tax=Novacetimonas cocois TaxID=1747507 RepID=UPI0010579DAE|nr:hypothetical protein [Novacetimonas cocois]
MGLLILKACRHAGIQRNAGDCANDAAKMQSRVRHASLSRMRGRLPDNNLPIKTKVFGCRLFLKRRRLSKLLQKASPKTFMIS